MKNTYDFYFDRDVFTCKYDNGKRLRVLRDYDALRMLHRIDRYRFSSFKVKENISNNRRRLYLEMNSNNNRVFIHSFKKFDENELFEEMPNHLQEIEKACDKYAKKRFSPKKEIVKKFVATATALALMTGGASLALNKDKSIYNSNQPYTIEQEYVNYEEANNIDTPIEKEVKEVTEVVKEEISQRDYGFEDKTDSETYKYVENNYSDVIERVSNERGISSELLMGMVTQESSGKDPNLMQITYSVWNDHVFTTYNFETGKEEKIVISNNPGGYKSSVKVLSPEDMNDPYNNITIGSLIFRDALETYDYNIPLAIQAYNFGYGNMNKVLSAYSEDSGRSRDLIISDTNNIDFTNYTNVVVGQGDSEYLNHVMRYVDTDKVSVKKLTNNDVIDIDFQFRSQSQDKTK
ncbi:MAG: transglycosylase SLT domain-containing protein [Bacilli bacterium]|nr:transglycosylase SLT domain-containing protein [Bacilli bacterium]